MNKIHPSEITPEHIYRSRRQFMRDIGVLVASSAILGACGQAAPTPTRALLDTPTAMPPSPEPTPTPSPVLQVDADDPTEALTDELGNPLTSYENVSGLTIFYEFATSRQGVIGMVEGFRSAPWTIEVGGLVRSPRTFDLDDLRRFGREERIYRMRCVEGWSMVIPWLGFPLARLLTEVEPTSRAKFVRFQTLADPEQMPGVRMPTFRWPYIEGLRLDEAMHDLTILSTGLYGADLLTQNGAPVRLLVPWKYGFKSIKSIVRIDLVDEMPTSFWMDFAPREYGFYANVNPEVNHPRWSQATELPIGETERRPTLLFNGYGEEVAALYADLDLREWF